MDQPIVIRAHHTYDFLKAGNLVLTDGNFVHSGDELANPTFKAANAARVIAKKFESDDPRDWWYAADTMGTPERKEEYRQKTEAVFQRFIEASHNHPVVVVTCEPDDMCRVNAVGNHCRMRRQIEDDKDKLRYWEDNYFNCFVDAYDPSHLRSGIRRCSFLQRFEWGSPTPQPAVGGRA